ncbi:unnamed protein product [Effrenium voratum]|uniref:CHAT domain-containing protein n=1 Tax=Effrenium voratum TaxID=2562239 RepID=A0AA36N360_9DINO|nr:unnamed protein product [Effrenium voratum]CAJ1459799.1 unnamed protein product [Effrenium voratum]
MFKVLALAIGLAQGLGNSSQGAHLGTIGNVARHRPCHPKPLCLHLVDGLTNLSDKSQALARSGPSEPVLIFLESPTLVSQIVVHCHQHGRPGVGRNLSIMIWEQLPGESRRPGPPTKRWSWDPTRHVNASDGFAVIVPLQHIARAVAVQWDAPVQALGARVEVEEEVWISEVLVIGKQKKEGVPMKKAQLRTDRRASSQSPTGIGSVSIVQEAELPSTAFTTSVQMHAMPDSVTNDWETKNSTIPHFPEAHAFLSPWPQDRRSDLGIKTGFGALLAAVILILKFKQNAFKVCRANDLEYNYDPLPAEVRDWPNILGAQERREEERRHEERVHQESQTEGGLGMAPALARSRSRSLERTASEPEPELELDPGASNSSADHSEEETSQSTQSTLSLGIPRGSSRASSSTESEASVAPSAPAHVAASASEVIMLYASPLAFRDGRGMTPLPQIPVEKEWDTLTAAYNEACQVLCRSAASPSVSISAQPLTAGNLQRAITTWHPGVLHLSAHGVQDCLVLEDGGGTAHFFSCEMLHGMLELAGSLRLVLLNACSLSSMGSQFTAAGVPHVICSSADLKDSASHVFLRSFYLNLFQGTSVQRAFNEAVLALRSHSERSLQAASHHFCLLPEGPHEEVLFPPKRGDESPDASQSDDGGRSRRRRRRPRRGKAQAGMALCCKLPPLPEDFLGRELDVWSVLQQLNQRRAVVVCAAPGHDFGIGKTVILDAVHRAFTLLGHSCVAVPLRSLSQASWAGHWIEKANVAIRLAMRECSARSTGGFRRRRVQGTPRTGFHPLSDPQAAACLLDDLVEDMLAFADLCDARPDASRILLLLDECDHLVQQQAFQDALAVLLQRCSSYSIVLSTHQPMVPAGASNFKVVQHRVQGLGPRDSARLLLRRAPRPLRWGEVLPDAFDPSSLVVLNKANESEVLDAVASQAHVAALKGNPRRLIELANNLESLSEN